MNYLVSSPDVHYMRFMKDGKVVRVARCITNQGEVFALYPSNEEGIFYTEAFRNVDDISLKGKIKANKVKDSIWRNLLSGKTVEDTVSGYRQFGFDGEYFLQKRRSRDIRTSLLTFEISELEEPTIQDTST